MRRSHARIFVVLPFLALAPNTSCVGDSTVTPQDSGTPDNTAADAPAAPFSLTATPSPILVPRNGTPANLTVKITRNAGFTNDVQVGVTNLPSGITATTQTATGGATQVVLSLTDSTATAGTVTATVTGTSGSSSASTSIIVEVPGTPGSVDTSFGTAGIFTGDSKITNFNYPIAAVIQPDGKIVIAATLLVATDAGLTTHIEVVRLTSSGALDTTFNTTGVNSAVVGAAGGVALQPDGKIVVGGRLNNTMQAVRYTTAGALDTTFNGQGFATFDHGLGGDDGTCVAVLPSGDIVVGGWGGSFSMVLASFSSTGVVNTAYSSKAIFSGPSGAADALGYSLTMQPSYPGFVVMGGCTDDPGGFAEFVRFDTTGAPTTFNGGSIVGYQAGAAPGGSPSMITLANQSFRAVSPTNTAGQNRVDGLTANGAADTAFNNTGSFTFTPNGSPNQIALGLDTNLVIVGNTTTPTGYVSRVLASGSALDSTFGSSGTVANVFGTGAGSSNASAVAIDAAGDIVVVGLGKIVAGPSGSGTLYVTRLWP